MMAAKREEDFLDGMANLFLDREESPVQGNHPLLQHLVLKKVFQHLDKDPETLLKCRQVCKAWKAASDQVSSLSLSIIIDEESNIESFLRTMSNPYAQLPSRTLTLRDFDSLDTQELVTLMETYGPSFKKLVLNQVTLQYFSFLFLPIWFPNLVSLTIDTDGVFEFDFNKPLKVPKLLRSAWKNPFPFLKRLGFSRGLDCELFFDATVNFFMFLLEKVPRLDELMLTVVPHVWEKVMPRLALIPETFNHVETLRFDIVTKSQLEMLKNLPMRLKHIDVLHILSQNFSSQAFAEFLKVSKDSLKQLSINEIENERVGKSNHLLLPCIMPNVETIHIMDFTTVKGPKGKRNIFMVLPNLRDCVLGANVGSKSDGKLFWDSLFPENKHSGTFVHLNVTLLRVDWFLENPKMISEIQQCLIGLKKLHLCISGNLLPVLVDVMKDSKIEELGITYFETDGAKVKAFTAGLTGINEEDCVRMIVRDEFSKADVKKNEELKGRPSLADWKYLERLEIAYRTGKCTYHTLFQPEQGRQILDEVAVHHCLMLMKKLRGLVLMHFKIETDIFRILVESGTLTKFGMFDCQIYYRNDQAEGTSNSSSNRNKRIPHQNNKRGRPFNRGGKNKRRF